MNSVHAGFFIKMSAISEIGKIIVTKNVLNPRNRIGWSGDACQKAVSWTKYYVIEANVLVKQRVAGDKSDGKNKGVWAPRARRCP